MRTQKGNFCFEHIIVDGASTDGSDGICGNYVLAEKSVFFVSEKDSGIYNAMNKGIKLASGSHLAFLNSGDVLADEGVLERISLAITNDKSLDLIYGDLSLVDGDGRVKREWVSGTYNRTKLYYGWIPPHPMTTISASVLKDVGNFDERLDISADYDLMLRVLLRSSANVKYIPDIFVHMELGGVSNSSLRGVIKANFEVLKSWVKNTGILSPYWIFLSKPLSKLTQIRN